ncbi:MAG TPA: hypothetical protein VFF23_14605 [Hanamia sp.]|nr:hypothetical protein [Hanamia sp.]
MERRFAFFLGPKINTHIKEICKEARIEEAIEKQQTKEGKKSVLFRKSGNLLPRIQAGVHSVQTW